MRKLLPKLLIIGLTLVFISGCNILYRQPVYQGTLLDKKNVDLLKEGMSQQEVFQLVGTPPIADPFHQSRWDFTATQRHRFSDMQVKTMTLYFENGNLVKWEGEYFPEQDLELAKEMRKFGNLPKDKDKKNRR
ncbi:MAG TPA: outer membrane protein assembly factor BamE [Arenimonas sp.]|nr:outer membrane protein assembly factor BamE [Arenimonas sp.]HOZ05198.1 outer membrane protein assembly factor BamE [Arenimonas sp.]HPO23642.1 outer membrane protein assembly factor BamE [Arenimonas sp.]HPW33122.1 outer membrane protein assembly factor BamE [Arenimonas sp.]